MGFFDFLKPKPKPVPSDPAELRDQLFDAVGKGDKAELQRLADARADLIAASFAGWGTLPEAERADPAIVEWVGNGLLGVARHFAKERGDESLMAALEGGDDNVITRWQDAMQEVDEALERGDVAAAEALLLEQLPVVRGLSGGSASTMQAMVLGRIGRVRFFAAPVDDAVDPLLEALEICREAEDVQGEHTYLGNLAEVFRYLGDWEQAADCLAEQAELAREADAGEVADRLAKQSEDVRAGEPLNRVLALIGESLVEVDQLPERVDMRVGFVFRRNRPSLPASELATAQGMALGGAGDDEAALALFQAASDADPLDPQPRYQAGVALLHLERAAEARDAFDAAERLAPGWYHVRSSRAMAAAVADGSLPIEAVHALHGMASDAPRADKVEAAQAALAELGPFPPLMLHLGVELDAMGRTAEAVQLWKDALATDPEPDVRSRLLGRLAAAEDEPDERARLLEATLAVEGGNLVARAAALAARTTGTHTH